MNKIGIRIKRIRIEKGFSQENMATELGLTQPSYARLEKEGAQISINRLINIAKILNTSVSDLIDESILKVKDEKHSENLEINKEYIETLKDEIRFLRKLIESREVLK
ncbi:helix-turn-helix domain-containing protein [Flavobacterium sp. FlaQc-48]|uniref:helix-turn-helix domain-containing protein n=1 Tax=Flavobacterium sp. FlaQc-48 TaxID=3374181 RepID=UPI003757F818